MAIACLAALLAVAGCGGGITPEHQAAFLKIQRIGGKVNTAKGGYLVDLSSTQAQDKDLEPLTHIANLRGLDLDRKSVV